MAPLKFFTVTDLSLLTQAALLPLRGLSPCLPTVPSCYTAAQLQLGGLRCDTPWTLRALECFYLPDKEKCSTAIHL